MNLKVGDRIVHQQIYNSRGIIMYQNKELYLILWSTGDAFLWHIQNIRARLEKIND